MSPPAFAQVTAPPTSGFDPVPGRAIEWKSLEEGCPTRPPMSSASTIAAFLSNGVAPHPVPVALEKLDLPSPRQGTPRWTHRPRT